MTDLEMWSLLVGVLAPFVAATVNRSTWPGWAKVIVVIVTSTIAGALTAQLAGELTGGTWLHSALVVGVAAVGSWRLIWHPSGIGPAWERATDLPPRTAGG